MEQVVLLHTLPIYGLGLFGSSMMAAGTALSIAVSILAVLGPVFVWAYLYRRCPECRKKWGLRSAGASEGGRSFWARRSQFECRACGHPLWRDGRLWRMAAGVILVVSVYLRVFGTPVSWTRYLSLPEYAIGVTTPDEILDSLYWWEGADLVIHAKGPMPVRPDISDTHIYEARGHWWDFRDYVLWQVVVPSKYMRE